MSNNSDKSCPQCHESIDISDPIGASNGCMYECNKCGCVWSTDTPYIQRLHELAVLHCRALHAIDYIACALHDLADEVEKFKDIIASNLPPDVNDLLKGAKNLSDRFSAYLEAEENSGRNAVTLYGLEKYGVSLGDVIIQEQHGSRHPTRIRLTRIDGHIDENSPDGLALFFYGPSVLKTGKDGKSSYTVFPDIPWKKVSGPILPSAR